MSKDILRISLAQINSTVGDLKGNLRKILTYIERARAEEADIVVFPELALTGYPPEDLLLKPQFLQDNIKILHALAKKVKGIVTIVGFVGVEGDIFNSLAVISEGEIKGVYHKILLPNYGVFDEYRYFQRGRETPVFLINGFKIGMSICEDIWYPEGPHLTQAIGGDAQILVNISASPFHVGKRELREKMLSTRAQECGAIVVYTNLVGGQDELVFDGGSLVFDEKGHLISRAKIFEEDLLTVDVEPEKVLRSHLQDPRRRGKKLDYPSPPLIEVSKEIRQKNKRLERRIEESPVGEKEIFNALVLGTRDYVKKNGFKKVLVGLSGGIDSSLVAGIAEEALGKENVIGVIMPSQYNAPSSMEDAYKLAKNLGIKTFTLPIQEIFVSYGRVLKKEVFKNLREDVTEENIQARIRGNLLMALSNKFGWLVLTTGNKSEMSCGYATLYGDMAGGFAVIKDVYKTEVYKIARFINKKKGRKVIPESVIRKPPSAELRPRQRDQDTLPPYEVLDPILKAYVEKEYSFEELLRMGYDKTTVKKVIRMVDRNEYKRRQSPPGIKISPRAFGRDRHLPITNRYSPFSYSKDEGVNTLDRP